MKTDNHSQQPDTQPETEPEILESDSDADIVAAERDEWRDKALRTAAEYENFRKRTARERETLCTEIRADTLAAMLPVYDNLCRASANPTEDAAYAKGIALIMQQWDDLFAKFNVAPLGRVGEPFDPKYHDAVAHIEDEELPENSIAEVFTQGFTINDRVLRHAVVKAAN